MNCRSDFTRLTVAVLGWLVLVSLTACGKIPLKDGYYSCEPGVSGTCPEGMTCVWSESAGEYRCVRHETTDAHIPDGLAPDAHAPDADIDAEVHFCGDGVVDPGEECDGQDLGGQTCQGLGHPGGQLACSVICAYDRSGCDPVPTCGDGDIDPNEQCDGSELGGATCESLGYASGTLSCSANCTFNTGACVPIPVCGNGQVESGEACDDGNTTGGDGCSADCLSDESCGNGIVDATVGEACDDGNTTGGDGCSADCLSDESCGNGIVDTAAGETCDDGNVLSGDGCNSTCRQEYCGDGVLQPALGEECDDGNNGSGDGCNSTCEQEYCGDGVLQPGLGEECDDGNAASEDGCSSACEQEYCGDGVVQLGLGEECDDGNTTSEDGCNSTCEQEYCGDGIVQLGLGEECDDGNTAGGDGCSATCQEECDPNDNIALQAGVVASSSGGGLVSEGYGPGKMIDGYGEPSCLTHNYHWVTAGSVPGTAWIQLQWSSAVTVARIRFDTTHWNDATCSVNTGRSLAGGDVQWWNGSSWQTDGTVSGQTNDWTYTFTSPVQTTRLRLYGAHATDQGSQNTNPMIIEWQVFACN